MQGRRMGLIQPQTPNQGHRPWIQLRNKQYFSNSIFPLRRREHVVSHGLGGRMPPAGCTASGKAEKNAGGEISLSRAAFFCFHSARGAVWFVSSIFMRKQKCLTILSFRKPESRGGTPLAQGYGGREGPCLDLVTEQRKRCSALGNTASLEYSV